MTNVGVPLIDLSPSYNETFEGKKMVAEQINSACMDLGFLLLPDTASRCRLSMSFAKSAMSSLSNLWKIK